MTQTNKIEIIFEAPDWIAVNKPAGLAVHNSEDSTNLLKELSRQNQIPKLHPVHRLDKETSGLQILALDEKAAHEWARRFQEKLLQKFYQGVTAGSLPDQGTWQDPLSDKAEGAKNPAGLSQDRKACETRFLVLKRSAYFSWAEFEIMTGRQHQIRKHCALHGRALIGDPRYGNPKYNQKIAGIYQFQRMALHSCRMIFDALELSCDAPKDFDMLFPNSGTF